MTNKTQQIGFSLIEMLVAATIFTFVIAGVTQLFTKATDLQRRATGYQKIQENAVFVMESIAREVRVSTIQGVSGCSSSLVIKHPVNGTVTYTYDQAVGIGEVTRSSALGGVQRITSDDVNITNLSFCISGGGAAPDQQQARVTIPMTLQAVTGKVIDLVAVSLQTTIVSRDLTLELTP